MVEFIAKNRVTRPHQGAYHSQIGHVAGAENDGGLGAFKSGQFGLHLLVQGQVPYNQAGGTGSHPPAVRSFPGRGDKARILGQAQIIVRRKVQQHPPVHPYPSSGECFLHSGQATPQILGC